AVIAKSKVFQALAKSKLGKAFLRAGQKVKAAWAKGKQAYTDAKAKLKAKWEKWKAEREKRKAERKAKAREKTIEAIKGMLSGGVSHLVLKARLLILRYQYGWKSLAAHANTAAGTVRIEGSMSPD